MLFCMAHPLFVLLWSIDSSFFWGFSDSLLFYLLFHQTPKCNESGFSLRKEDNPNLVFTEEKNQDVQEEWSSLLKSPAVTPCQLSNRCPFPLADCWWKKEFKNAIVLQKVNSSSARMKWCLPLLMPYDCRSQTVHAKHLKQDASILL